MAQYRKDDVKQRIQDAALWNFAHWGFQASTLADVAQRAGVSTGNVYRYYLGKESLYRELVSPVFMRRFTTLLHQRVASLRGVQDVAGLAPDAAFHVLSGQLLEFCIENRLKVVTLLVGSVGTPNQEFGQELAHDLTNRAIRHFRELRPGLRVSQAHRFTLEQVYQGFVVTSARLLRELEDPKALAEAIRRYSAYHLAGLNALFQEMT